MTEKKGIKYWYGLWAANCKYFFRHPIKFSKEYIEDFKKQDVIGKLKKIGLTVLSLFLLYQATIIVVTIFTLFIVLGLFGADPVYDYYDLYDEDLF